MHLNFHVALQFYICPGDQAIGHLVENIFGSCRVFSRSFHRYAPLKNSTAAGLKSLSSLSDTTIMRYLITTLLFFSVAAAFAKASDTPCEQSHKQALLKCKAYEHHISADQIRSISQQTRVRVAEKETDKLFGMGRACAEAQKQCSSSCTASAKGNSKLDITDLIELQSDCTEGQVADHRSRLAEKYLNMKAVLEEARKPASR